MKAINNGGMSDWKRETNQASIAINVSATTSLVIGPQRGELTGFGSIMIVDQILALKTPPRLFSAGAKFTCFIRSPE
jgi:hypothetical protein